MRRRDVAWVCAGMIAGVIARVWLVTLGHSEDFTAYRAVVDIVDRGGNVYAETSRYNYGPVWFNVLFGLSHLPRLVPDAAMDLRLKVVALLTLTDCVIAWLLLRRHGTVAGLVFILNPVSIIITGLHSQFDNLAILVGLLAAARLDDRQGRWWVWPAGLAALGVSLAIKHALFAFPAWLAFREPTWGRRAQALGIPVAVFLASFLPYWSDGAAGIVDHVLLYRSSGSSELWFFLPAGGAATAFFVSALLLAGLQWRRRSVWDLMLRYLVLVVILAPAEANQYLAIPLAAVAAGHNWLYGGYWLVAAAWLAVRYDAAIPRALGWRVGPGDVLPWLSYRLVIGVLASGLLLALWRERERTRPEG